MGLALWALVSALAVSATLGFPKGPDWHQLTKHNDPSELKKPKYQSPLDKLAGASEIRFPGFESNTNGLPKLEKTRSKKCSIFNI